MKKLLIALSLSLSLSSCKYSNTFQGTYNDSPASMTAYSRNINRYCVALNLTAGDQTKKSYISSKYLFDPNDFLKPTSFNSKGDQCQTNLDEYLVGTRNTTVLGDALVYREENVNYNYCQSVFYKQYQYKEDVKIDFKKTADDQLVGTFVGVGNVDYYIDYGHPVAYGPIYYCGPIRPRPYPHPYPYPDPDPHPHSMQ
jgi:hypothetical protein